MYKRKAYTPLARPATRRRLFPPRTTRRIYRRKAIRTVRGAFAKRVKAVINRQLETKYNTEQSAVALAINGGAVTSTPVTNSVVASIPAGTTDNQRIGDVIQCTSYECNYVFSNTAAFTTYLRVTLLRILNQNATADFAQATSLWYNDRNTNDAADFTTNATGTPLENITMPFRSDAVKVIFDKVMKIGKSTAVEGHSVRNLRIRVPLKFKMEFDGASFGALKQTNRLYMQMTAWSPQGVAAITRNGYEKLYYKDA